MTIKIKRRRRMIQFQKKKLITIDSNTSEIKNG